jgi:putative FmdB family regulatory protein
MLELDASVPKMRLAPHLSLRGRAMPFYEYECSACKFYVEALQKISEPPLRKCPSCRKQTLKRLISAPVFRLKGGGWYETDFKSDQEAKRNLAGSEESAEPKAEDSKKDGAEAKKPAEAQSKTSESKASESKAGESKPDKAKAAAARKRPVAKPSKTPVRAAAKLAKPRAAAKPARKKSGRR